MKIFSVSKDNIWIGLTAWSNNWKWTDNSPMDFNNWSQNYPTTIYTTIGEAACVKMTTDGTWRNNYCKGLQSTAPFMCSHARQWSNCVMADAEKQPCGFPGITQAVSFKCYHQNKKYKKVVFLLLIAFKEIIINKNFTYEY